MSLDKRTYTDGVTVITASNLNAIQDEVIANATAISGKANQSTTYTKTEVDTALSSKAGTDTATSSANGLMSATDKSKLDSITVANLENISNKKTSIGGSSTDTDYPSAKAVYTAISSAISGVTQFDYTVVSSLPATGVKGTIYLVRNSETVGSNFYDEYIYLASPQGRWEKIGTTEVDLTNYYTKTEVDTALNGKANTSTTYTKTEVNTALNTKQDTISDLSTIRSNATAVTNKEAKGKCTINSTEYEVVISNTDAGQTGKIVFYVE